jgi:NADPH:quinone reductase-like Zn-dependent oxidoreductase
MKVVRLRAPGGLESLEPVEDDQPEPGPSEVLVRIRASSLNFHDDMVIHGKIPVADAGCHYPMALATSSRPETAWMHLRSATPSLAAFGLIGWMAI